MLVVDPLARITIANALSHQLFQGIFDEQKLDMLAKSFFNEK